MDLSGMELKELDSTSVFSAILRCGAILSCLY